MKVDQKLKISLVPWFNKNEWNFVYNALYKENSLKEDKRKALEVLRMWKLRNQSLPTGIEGTLIVLQALEKSLLNTEEYDLQVLYSTAVLRFLNVCAGYDTKQGTFSKTAANVNIPRWMIDMRHDIAHGVNLPSLDMLSRALEFAYKWLQDEYWLPFSKNFEDYVYKHNDSSIQSKVPSELEDNVTFFIKTLECLIICQLPQFKIHKLLDIPDVEARNNILKSIKQNIPSSNVLETISLKTLTNYLISSFRSVLEENSSSHLKSLIVDSLISGDTFICDFYLENKIIGTNKSNAFPKEFILLWSDLMQLFVDFSIMEQLISTLATIALQIDEGSTNRHRFASFWIIEIMRAFRKIKLIQRKCLNSVQEVKRVMNNEVDVYQSIVEQIENENSELKIVLRINPAVEIPSVLRNLRQFQTVFLDHPNNYTLQFFTLARDIFDPPLTEDLQSKIINLIETFVNHENLSNSTTDKIYSIGDLNTSCENVLTNISSDEGRSSEESDSDNHWRVASDHIVFKRCPFGLLPWQDCTNNPVLEGCLSGNQQL